MSGYTCSKTLTTFGDSINCIVFSPDGLYLAIGSDDRTLRVLDHRNGVQLRKIYYSNAITSLVWHTKQRHVLFVGSHDGEVVLVHFEEGQDLPVHVPLRTGVRAPVECMSFDSKSGALAVVVGTEVIVYDRLDDSSRAHGRNLSRPPDYGVPNSSHVLPRYVHFCKAGGSLVVAYFEHGIAIWPSVKSNTARMISPVHRRIGQAAISPDEKLIAVCNLCDGFDVYDISTGDQTHHFPIVLTENYILPVLFIHSGKVLLCGSPCGFVTLFSLQTKETIHVLPHDKSIITAIAYVEGVHRYIVTGSAGTGSNTFVKLWEVSKRGPKGPNLARRQPRFCQPSPYSLAIISTAAIMCLSLLFNIHSSAWHTTRSNMINATCSIMPVVQNLVPGLFEQLLTGHIESCEAFRPVEPALSSEYHVHGRSMKPESSLPCHQTNWKPPETDHVEGSRESTTGLLITGGEVVSASTASIISQGTQ